MFQIAIPILDRCLTDHSQTEFEGNVRSFCESEVDMLYAGERKTFIHQDGDLRSRQVLNLVIRYLLETFKVHVVNRFFSGGTIIWVDYDKHLSFRMFLLLTVFNTLHSHL